MEANPRVKTQKQPQGQKIPGTILQEMIIVTDSLISKDMFGENLPPWRRPWDSIRRKKKTAKNYFGNGFLEH